MDFLIVDFFQVSILGDVLRAIITKFCNLELSSLWTP